MLTQMVPIGPLHAVSWQAKLVLEDTQVPIEIKSEGIAIPLPPKMAQGGWVCFFNKRSRGPAGMLQSIVCKYSKEATFGATTICATDHQDVDVQRVTVGNDKTGMIGIWLGCRSEQVVGAEL